MRPLGANWSEDGSQDGAKRPYVRQLGAQDGQLGSMLGAIWAHLKHLGANFNENNEKAKKIKKTKSFVNDFGRSGAFISAYLEAMWGYIAASWL